MRMTIRRVLLWPKDEQHEVRVLDFEPGKINLLTGRSRTGKSAVTYIVDYVLGSGKCAIPVGDIRRTVAWYGLVLDLGDGQLIVAREEPRGRVESGNYYMDERELVSVPARPTKNTNRDAFKNRMNLLAGLPSLGFDVEATGAGFLGRPSFRDMAAFNFLPQHIVANPYTLFFKADTTEHRQKLRTIFPFVLGAVTAEDLLAEHEHAELERQLRRLQAQLERRERAADAWKAEALGLHGRALDLGLLPPDTPRPESLATCIRDLMGIPAVVGTEPAVPALAPGTTLAAAERLDQVRTRERSVDRALAELRTRLQRVRGLKSTMEEFGGVTADQAGRVHGVGWLQKNLSGSAPCPMCGSDHDLARERLDRLAAAATELASRRRAAGEAPVALEREEHDLLVRVRQQEELLRDLRTERGELENARAKSGGQSLDEVYRFVGRVEEAIKNLRETEEGAVLRTQIVTIQERMDALRQMLDPSARQRKLDAALQLFSRHVAHYANFLDLERSADAIELKISELTLIFTAQTRGREDFLWEIGSGANWMGYHVAALLALHQVFLSAKNSHVPTFLIIDQPSQVYFPAGWPEHLDALADGPLQLHDVAATRRIFEALAEGLRRMGSRLQIIVTEHADMRTLGVMPAVHTVVDWHRDDVDYLIPRAWLRAPG